MNYKNPQTLVKSGRYDYPLEEAVKKFREKLEPIAEILGNTVKYATFNQSQEPYLLIVSQQKHRLVTPLGYNVLLTIASRSEQRNKEISDQFELDTGIDLCIEIPESLRRMYDIIGMTFMVFERNPIVAMDILKGKPI